MLYSLSSNVLHLQSASVYSSRLGAVIVSDFQKSLEKVWSLVWTSWKKKKGLVQFNVAESIPYFHVDLSLEMQWALKTSQVPLLNNSLLSHL